MTVPSAFRADLSRPSPPETLTRPQKALWWAGKQNWQKAHDLVQEAEGNPECDRIHAFLHRQEGDLANARYWYRRAHTSMPDLTLQEEWQVLVQDMIG
ncbi:hypothetical protein [Gluconobacter morbifer]|uniref:Uncharacterized protein n=1 Tax=Gluconobacter morbifer G707 TaxID=1088869 RepID=G6XM99_9PROT|nr:hypothetical protein [Gluconobacter morbifer]EHH66997.1 hypothetical protein GMO_26170 [Gluconobacter morbifer G707]